MGDVKIESKNQSGGITAQNINTSGKSQVKVNDSLPLENKIKRFFWWLFGIAGFTAALATIISLL